MKTSLPDISNAAYFSFKTPKGRYIEIMQGRVIETYYSKWDRVKYVVERWTSDEDVVSGLLKYIKTINNTTNQHLNRT